MEVVNKLVLVFNKPFFFEEHSLNFWFKIVNVKIAILVNICCQIFYVKKTQSNIFAMAPYNKKTYLNLLKLQTYLRLLFIRALSLHHIQVHQYLQVQKTSRSEVEVLDDCIFKPGSLVGLQFCIKCYFFVVAFFEKTH